MIWTSRHQRRHRRVWPRRITTKASTGRVNVTCWGGLDDFVWTVWLRMHNEWCVFSDNSRNWQRSSEEICTKYLFIFRAFLISSKIIIGIISIGNNAMLCFARSLPVWYALLEIVFAFLSLCNYPLSKWLHSRTPICFQNRELAFHLRPRYGPKHIFLWKHVSIWVHVIWVTTNDWKQDEEDDGESDLHQPRVSMPPPPSV